MYPAGEGLTSKTDRRNCLDNQYPWQVKHVGKVLEKHKDMSYNNPMLNRTLSLRDFNKTF